MGDSQPASINVTTTNVTPAISTPKVNVNTSYIKTIPFFIRVACVVLAIIVLICAGTAKFKNHNGFKGTGFINFTAATGLIISVVLIVIFILSLNEKVLSASLWAMIDMGVNALWALFYFISGCIAIAYARKSKTYADIVFYGNDFQKSHDSYAAAVFFCWLAAIAHAALAFFAFRIWWASRSSAAGTVTVGQANPTNYG